MSEQPKTTDESPKTFSAADIRNIALNAALQAIDKLIQDMAEGPEVQMGILMLAQVKAFRRLTKSLKIQNRGKRHKLASMALKDFETKMKQFGMDDEPTPAVDVTAGPNSATANH